MIKLVTTQKTSNSLVHLHHRNFLISLKNQDEVHQISIKQYKTKCKRNEFADYKQFVLASDYV